MSDEQEQMARDITQLFMCIDSTVLTELLRNLLHLNSNPNLGVWIEQMKKLINTKQEIELENHIFAMLGSGIKFSASCEEVVASNDLQTDHFVPSEEVVASNDLQTDHFDLSEELDLDAVHETIQFLKTCEKQDIPNIVTFNWIATICEKATWLSDEDRDLMLETLNFLIV